MRQSTDWFLARQYKQSTLPSLPTSYKNFQLAYFLATDSSVPD